MNKIGLRKFCNFNLNAASVLYVVNIEWTVRQNDTRQLLRSAEHVRVTLGRVIMILSCFIIDLEAAR